MTDAIRNPFLMKVVEADQFPEDPNFPFLLPPQYAQAGEDLVVLALVRGYCARRGLNERDQTYCDIGAYHPILNNSTYLLSEQLGMSGVLVDANEDVIAALRERRPRDTIVHAAITDTDDEKASFTISTSPGLSSLDGDFMQLWQHAGYHSARRVEVPAIHINKLFKQHFEAKPAVYLALDVEGMDLRLLKSMNWQSYRPYIVQAEPFDLYEKNSAEGMIATMQAADYRLMAKTKSNLIFVDVR